VSSENAYLIILHILLLTTSLRFSG